MGSSSTAVPQGRSPLLRKSPPRFLVWLAFLALAALALHFLVPTIARYTHVDAAHYRGHWLDRWWLAPHLAGGTLALLMGPPQFSAWLRRRYLNAHRWMGRLYLVGVLVGSIACVPMGLDSKHRGFGIGLLYLDLAWVVTTGMAYLSILRLQIPAHREWMVRSYVVTFAFVTFRLLQNDLNLYSSIGLDSQLTMLSWMCWAVPLLLTEVALQWRRSVG
jgi:hypothetical protein